jgi:hypothetical protein
MKDRVAESTDEDVEARQVVGAALVGQVVAAQHVLAPSYHFRYSICNIHQNYQKPVRYRTINICVSAPYRTQCCGSGSCRIGMISPDPHRDLHPGPTDPEPAPDLCPFQPNVKKKLYFFFRKLPILFKILKYITLAREIIECKLA